MVSPNIGYSQPGIPSHFNNVKLDAWYQQTSEIKITCYKEAQLYDGTPQMYDIAILSSPVRCPEISRSQCLCTCVHLKETGIENAGAQQYGSIIRLFSLSSKNQTRETKKNVLFQFLIGFLVKRTRYFSVQDDVVVAMQLKLK